MTAAAPGVDDRFNSGLAAVDRIYGPGASAEMAALAGVPLADETVAHMFGEIWTRPGLSIRDRRLLVIGATTMLGRADLLEVHIGGALANGELSDVELDEIALLMLFYAGAGNSTALYRGIQLGKGRAAAQREKAAHRVEDSA